MTGVLIPEARVCTEMEMLHFVRVWQECIGKSRPDR